MNVVWHDDKRDGFNIWKMVRNFIPPFLNDLPIFIQLHLPIHNFPKQTFSLVGNNRHNIYARL